MPKGSAAIGRVLPREKAGVESVPWRMLTASTALLNCRSLASDAEAGVAGPVLAACAGFSPRRVEPITARPVVLRKFLRLVPALLSLISANVHSWVAVEVRAMIQLIVNRVWAALRGVPDGPEIVPRRTIFGERDGLGEG
jgi:hypothetical protein